MGWAYTSQGPSNTFIRTAMWWTHERKRMRPNQGQPGKEQVEKA